MAPVPIVSMIDVIQNGVPYMFIPAWTSETLREFPTLAGELGDPAEEVSRPRTSTRRERRRGRCTAC
jgi:hypothetical protein